jgi:hypothetical protein
VALDMMTRWNLVIVALCVLGAEVRGRGVEEFSHLYGSFDQDELLVRVVRQSLLEGQNDENTISVFQVSEIKVVAVNVP